MSGEPICWLPPEPVLVAGINNKRYTGTAVPASSPGKSWCRF